MNKKLAGNLWNTISICYGEEHCASSCVRHSERRRRAPPILMRMSRRGRAYSEATRPLEHVGIEEVTRSKTAMAIRRTTQTRVAQPPAAPDAGRCPADRAAATAAGGDDAQRAEANRARRSPTDGRPQRSLNREAGARAAQRAAERASRRGAQQGAGAGPRTGRRGGARRGEGGNRGSTSATATTRRPGGRRRARRARSHKSRRRGARAQANPTERPKNLENDGETEKSAPRRRAQPASRADKATDAEEPEKLE